MTWLSKTMASFSRAERILAVLFGAGLCSRLPVDSVGSRDPHSRTAEPGVRGVLHHCGIADATGRVGFAVDGTVGDLSERHADGLWLGGGVEGVPLGESKGVGGSGPALGALDLSGRCSHCRRAVEGHAVEGNRDRVAVEPLVVKARQDEVVEAGTAGSG